MNHFHNSVTSSTNSNDFQSQNCSIEIHDAIINESWDWSKVQRNCYNRRTSKGFNAENNSKLVDTLVTRLWRFWNERAINNRLSKFDATETNHQLELWLSRVDEMLADERRRNVLSGTLMCAKTSELLQDSIEVLQRKYGTKMTELLIQVDNSGTKKKRMLKKSLLPFFSDNNDEILLHLKAIDPLTNWFKQSTDISGRMMARIQNLAESISKRVGWSFLIDTGRPRTDLSEFISEFDILDGFFEKVELSAEETSQKAFEANYSHKVRNRKLTCVDYTRVKLNIPIENIKLAHDDESNSNRSRQAADIFGDSDCPRIFERTEFGYGDFMNASRIVGGPLLNHFILTQAPLPNTTNDFWRMVWQEKPEYIFMLCDAVDSDCLANVSFENHCPYYWPRFEGMINEYGRINVENVRIDSTLDPLFSVTQLCIWASDDPDVKLRLQHWQWDWRDYTDFHWPLRLLIRARHSKRPTIVMCLDGCGRSGTLVLIEILLMQLLRGAVSYENPMLTSAVFLRLQRRYAVANYMQYLFVYRTVLHWIQPFVISLYHRFVLGFTGLWAGGFIFKYEQIAQSFPFKRGSNLLL